MTTIAMMLSAAAAPPPDIGARTGHHRHGLRSLSRRDLAHGARGVLNRRTRRRAGPRAPSDLR